MHRLAAAVCLSAALLAMAAPAAAEEAPAATATPPEDAGGRAGVGASVGGDGHVLVVPIRLGRAYRLELEVSQRSAPGVSDRVGFGLGLLRIAPVAERFQTYLGVRLQSASVMHGSPDTDATTIGGSLVLGGEWLAVPRLSLGVEGRVGYAKAGLSTASLLTARAYLW